MLVTLSQNNLNIGPQRVTAGVDSDARGVCRFYGPDTDMSIEERQAKVVTAAGGTELIQCEEQDEFILFFKWSQFKMASTARHCKNSVLQAEATTFGFSFCVYPSCMDMMDQSHTYVTVASAPAATGSVFAQRLRFYLKECRDSFNRKGRTGSQGPRQYLTLHWKMTPQDSVNLKASYPLCRADPSGVNLYSVHCVVCTYSIRVQTCTYNLQRDQQSTLLLFLS